MHVRKNVNHAKITIINFHYCLLLLQQIQQQTTTTKANKPSKTNINDNLHNLLQSLKMKRGWAIYDNHECQNIGLYDSFYKSKLFPHSTEIITFSSNYM